VLDRIEAPVAKKVKHRSKVILEEQQKPSTQQLEIRFRFMSLILAQITVFNQVFELRCCGNNFILV